jgi:hypothetical protein
LLNDLHRLIIATTFRNIPATMKATLTRKRNRALISSNIEADRAGFLRRSEEE